MRFSVVLNNYNYGCFVSEAIESVLGQTHGDLELLAVDDGSTDESREIISRYNDPRLTTIFQSNCGQGAALASGIARASGDYIAFLDSDDFWEENKLERCAALLDAEPDILLLNHAYQVIDVNGSPSGVPYSFSRMGLFNLAEDLRQHVSKSPLVPTSFFLGRRRECLQLKLDPNKWRIAADTPIIVGLGLRGKTYNLPECLGYYRMHGANASKTYNRCDDEGFVAQCRDFYEFANEEMQRLGFKEHFDFSKTDVAINHSVLRTSKYSVKGLYYRWVKFLNNCRGRVRQTEYPP